MEGKRSEEVSLAGPTLGSARLSLSNAVWCRFCMRAHALCTNTMGCMHLHGFFLLAGPTHPRPTSKALQAGLPAATLSRSLLVSIRVLGATP